jgi:CRP-like cAMP-binding protein
MSTKDLPARSQGRSAKLAPPVRPARSAKSAREMAEPPRFQTSKPNRKNGETVFDAETFLARVGLGRKIVNLKKNQVAFSQGDPADAIFYIQKGRLRVTVTAANGKEATITLVSAGEFLGENCMVSAHPVRLATAAAMTDCVLLRINKAEMVRVLHQEQELSDMFISFSSLQERSHPGRPG